MKVETLEELKGAFEAWRSEKRYKGEAIPSDLRERTHRAMDVHGLGVVAKAMKLDQSRFKAERGRRIAHGAGIGVPSYSRMQLAPAPVAVAERPFAEVETPTGLKVRLFTPTAEALGLVSSLLVMGGAR